MATVYQDSVAHGGFHPLQGLGLRVARFFANLAEKRQRAREIEVLTSFSERELRDVGLSRSDMMALERGVYRRD